MQGEAFSFAQMRRPSAFLLYTMVVVCTKLDLSVSFNETLRVSLKVAVRRPHTVRVDNGQIDHY